MAETRLLTLSTGRQLHVTLQGSGTPLLLLHGFPLDHRMWAHQAAALSDEFQVIVPDLRGFGGSSLEPSQGVAGGSSEHPAARADGVATVGSQSSTHEPITTMADFAADVAEVIMQLQLATPLAVGGLSMGGYVLWELLSRHRPLVGKLILCHTRATADAVEVARGRLLAADQFLAEGLTKLSDEMPAKLLGPPTAPRHTELLQQCRDWIRAQSPRAAAAAQRGMAARRDMTDLLPEIDLPTLVIAGSDDRITPADGMRQMADQIPGSVWHLVPGAGHMSPIEAPEEVNQVLRAFLRSSN